jgi:hypothetical protein
VCVWISDEVKHSIELQFSVELIRAVVRSEYGDDERFRVATREPVSRETALLLDISLGDYLIA